ncbi:MAG: response regulator [Lachnospiraceae bacterium]|nr:response regulator [Lachnospiraceae bacterium]
MMEGLSEELKIYYDIANESTNGIYVIDKCTDDILYTNRALEDDLKNKGKQEIIGTKCYKLLHNRTEKCARCAAARAKEEGHACQMYNAYFHKHYMVNAHDVIWHGHDASVVYVNDITEQKMEEKRVAEVQNNLFIAMGHAHMIYWEYDIDTSTVYVNQAAQQFFGIGEVLTDYPESFLKLGFVEDSYVDLYREKVEEIKHGRDYLSFDARIKSLIKDYEWMKIRLTAVKDEKGQTKRAICTAEIITEYKKMEKLYQDAVEYRKHTQVENLLLSGHCSVLKNKILDMVDQTGMNLIDKFGDVREEFFRGIGTYIIDEKERKLFYQNFLNEGLTKLYGLGIHKQTMVCEMRTDDNKKIWADIRVDIVKDPETGDIQGFLSMIDITATRKASKVKTDFLSRMSHDLRTPINAIIGLTALTLDAADNPEEVRENMAKMRYSSDYMLNLVNDILDMEKLEDGSVELLKEPYEYKDFLTSLQTMFTAQCEQKKISIHFAEPKINPVILTDRTRLNQIFSNILSNALKYTQTGGKIEYCVEKLKMDDDRLSCDFIIRDNGIGMSEKFQEHMFEPFVQEDNRITANLEGSGLGLSITKHLVEDMGGTIQIESKKNVGTTVRIHMNFKLVKADEAAHGRIDIEGDNLEFLYNKNILLAEDHPLNAEIAKKLLEKQGIHVIQAENGKKAVDLFMASAEYYFDAILMDIRMPEMDGIESAQTIRHLKRADALNVPIIAMSANAYKEDMEKSIAAGMNAHLSKPINIGNLYHTLIEYIKSNKDRKQKVLIVDDAEVNRAVLRSNLDNQYEILEAENGEDAMTVLLQNPDIICVITDIQMPNMNGKELVEKIRSQEKYEHIKIIANTQYGDPKQEEELIMLGANEFLYKPISPKVLVLRLHNVLNGK